MAQTENLSERQQDWLDELLQRPPEIVRAYELALRFDAFYELDDPDSAEEYFTRWIEAVRESDIEPLINFAEMLEDHWPGVMRWHHSRISNGLLEGLNSLIQAAKRRPRLPHQPQLHRDDLPRRRQTQRRARARVRVNPHERWRSPGCVHEARLTTCVAPSPR